MADDVPHLPRTVGITEARESIEYARANGQLPSAEVMAKIDAIDAEEKRVAELKAKEREGKRWKGRARM